MSDDIDSILDIHAHLEDALSSTVKIDWRQVLALVVADLTAKYKLNAERGNTEWAEAFKKVLSYYLDENEMKEITG